MSDAPSARLLGASEHPLSPRMIHPEAHAMLRALRARGHRAWLTGGCVRDLVLRVVPSDFDIATSATPEQIETVMEGGARPRRTRFRATLSAPDTLEVDVIAMSDPPWIPEDAWQRHPRTGDVEGDFARAFDFSVNALLYDPVADVLVDHVGGLDDLRHRTLRALNDPRAQLARNHTATVRGVTLAARRELAIDARTLEAMRANASAFADALPRQRNEALLRVLTSGVSATVFAQLHALGALAHVVGDDVAAQYGGGSPGAVTLARLDARLASARRVATLLGALLRDAARDLPPRRIEKLVASMARRFPFPASLWHEVRDALLALRPGAARPTTRPLRHTVAWLRALEEVA